MLGKTYMYQFKNYCVGDIVETIYGDKYIVIKNLGVAFRQKRNCYKLDVEKV